MCITAAATTYLTMILINMGPTDFDFFLVITALLCAAEVTEFCPLMMVLWLSGVRAL